MIILYNPHVDDLLARPIHFRLINRRPLKKYGFLIDQARMRGEDVFVLVDGTSSGLMPERLFRLLPSFMRNLWATIEFQLWKIENNFGAEVRRATATVGNSNDVILAFSYKAATGNFYLRRPLLSKYRAVIFHLSHYFISTKEKADNIHQLDNSFLAGDSDISECEYFKEYFSWYERPLLTLPFSVGDRFIDTRAWQSRDERAVATGTYHNLELERPARKYKDFIMSTGCMTYHPMRKIIFDASNFLSKLIKCNISPYRNYKAETSKLLNTIFGVSQKKYFSIDIVDLYNSHKFAVVGEELSGFPALGAFEAMACGCVLVAPPKFYMGLNIEPNVHFISYDNTLNGLVRVLSDISHRDCSKISIAGSQYIEAKLRPNPLYLNWIIEINKI